MKYFITLYLGEFQLFYKRISKGVKGTQHRNITSFRVAFDSPDYSRVHTLMEELFESCGPHTDDLFLATIKKSTFVAYCKLHNSLSGVYFESFLLRYDGDPYIIVRHAESDKYRSLVLLERPFGFHFEEFKSLLRLLS